MIGSKRAGLPRFHFTPETEKRLVLMVWLVFCVIILWISWHHEPWLDEAQAWLLVKDSSLWDLLAHRLRYEGHPPLWYLLLWLPVKAGLPYRFYWAFPVLLAAIAAWLMLYRSPFPLVVRVLIPFGFFTLYQYGIIVRSYALVPPLLFWLALSWPDRFQRPWRFWTPVLLLLISEVQGMVFAMAAIGLSVLDLVSLWNQIDVRSRNRFLGGIGLSIIVLISLVWMLWPPSDVALSLGLRDKNVVLFVSNAITGFSVLSILVLGMSFLWMDRYRSLLLYVAIMAGLFILAGHVYKIYHEGMFFLAWLFAMWVAWGRFRDNPDKERVDIHPMWDRAVRVAVVGAMILVCLVHAWWAAHAAMNDLLRPYSGSKQLARYMSQNIPKSDTVFATSMFAVSTLPWMDYNPFLNLVAPDGGRYMYLSNKNPLLWYLVHGKPEDMKSWIIKANPDWLVVPVNGKQNQPTVDMAMHLPGYQAVRLFKGEQFWKTGVFRLDGYLLMHRVTAPEAGHE